MNERIRELEEQCGGMAMNDPIGGTGLPLDAQQAVSELVAMLAEKYYFRQGETAAFWAIAYTLAGQLGEGRE